LSETLKGRDHFEDSEVVWRLMLNLINLKEIDVMVRTGFSWLYIASSGGILWTRY